MKQILQDLKQGDTIVENVPVPLVRAGHLLIHTRSSLVSAGTERMLLEFGRAGFLEKARQQPDKVRQVFDKLRTDGIGPTMRSVQAKLDKPIPLGYSNAGVVVEVGAGVLRFTVGDRVVSNGPHAEYVCVPENLCAVIPAAVSDEAACFTVVSAIALQGIRLVQPTLGETVVVTGLGLIGLLAVQLLRANGCQVLGIDPDPGRGQQHRAVHRPDDQRAGSHPGRAHARRFARLRGAGPDLRRRDVDQHPPILAQGGRAGVPDPAQGPDG